MLFRVELIASSFLDLISKQSDTDHRFKRVLVTFTLESWKEEGNQKFDHSSTLVVFSGC